MPKRYPSWFTPLPVRKKRPSVAKRIPQRDGAIRQRTSMYRVDSFGKKMRIGGEIVRYYTLNDIVKVLNLKHRKTIYFWYYRGVLPEPFLVRPIAGRDSPIYLRGQVRAIVHVVNYLYEHGVVYIHTLHHEKFIQMMHEGSALAVERHQKKLANKYRIKVPDVEWID